jgi:dihydropteroate synthase
VPDRVERPELARARRIAHFAARVTSEMAPVGPGRGRGRSGPCDVRLDRVDPEVRSVLLGRLRSAGVEVVAVEEPGDARSVTVRLHLPPAPSDTSTGSSASPDAEEAIAAAYAAFENRRAARAAFTVPGVHRPLPVGGRTRVMGVVNVTPDSFSDGGQFLRAEDALDHAARLISEGCELLDVGAESTRPGAVEVRPEAEWKRLAPVLTRLHATSSVPISVDTRHAEVARRAIDAGADVVNDVSGLRDPAMRALLVRTGAPAVLMHMRGTPATMQKLDPLPDVVGGVYGELADALVVALEDGIAPERLLVDPGLGFGKTPEQNLLLVGHLGEFASLGRPLVLGASRKLFLGRALGEAPVTGRLEAGLAAAVLAAEQGAALVRTHDVGPTVRALRLTDAVRAGAFGTA